jgi:hypothetical protein
MFLPRDTVMSWSGNRITEHNRGPITVTPNRIEKSSRMADGSLRKNVIATKNSYSVSWSMVPSLAAQTVDGFYGGRDILEFYRITTGPFTLTLRYDDTGSGALSKVVVFSSAPSYEIVNRSSAASQFDLINVSIEMEEV